MTVQDTVYGILEKHVESGCRTIRLNDRLREDLLITSLNMMVIVLELEETLGSRLGADELSRIVTVKDLVCSFSPDAASS